MLYNKILIFKSNADRKNMHIFHLKKNLTNNNVQIKKFGHTDTYNTSYRVAALLKANIHYSHYFLILTICFFKRKDFFIINLLRQLSQYYNLFKFFFLFVFLNQK